jgi:hypothetical protein
MTMKRVVDYPRLYDSAKLASLPSDELRGEYAWMLGIAGPNGSFEWSERRIWAAAYAPLRDKTIADIGGYLRAFLAAGLLVKWDQDGKTWGYFVGSEKPSRLPRDSWKKRFARSRQPEPAPPVELLRQPRVAIAHNERESSTDAACKERTTGVPLLECLSLSEGESESEENPSAHSLNEREADSLGDVSGNGENQTARTDTSKEKRLAAARRAELVANLYQRYPKKVAKADAYKAIDKAIVAVAKAGATDAHPNFNGDEAAAAQWLEIRVDLYAQSPQAQQPDKSKVPYPATWFNGARYDDDSQEWNHVASVGGGPALRAAQPLGSIDHKAGLKERADGSLSL